MKWDERCRELIRQAKDGILKCEIEKSDQKEIQGFVKGIEAALSLFEQDKRIEVLDWKLCSKERPELGSRFLLIKNKRTVIVTAYYHGFLIPGMPAIVEWERLTEFNYWTYVNGPKEIL